MNDVISLSNAKANNGQWHTVTLIRSGQWIQLKMDSGEGRYFNEVFSNQQGSKQFSLSRDRIVSGSRVVYDPNARFDGRGLVDSKFIVVTGIKMSPLEWEKIIIYLKADDL